MALSFSARPSAGHREPFRSKFFVPAAAAESLTNLGELGPTTRAVGAFARGVPGETMTLKVALVIASLSVFAVGCESKEAAADAPCSTVVEKMASMSPGSGDAEKKLWTAAC